MPTNLVMLQAGDIRVDPASGRAWRGARELALTRRELEVLALLVEHVGSVVTREELMGGMWDDARTRSPDTVDVHVHRLRRELGDPGRITADRGVGFRLHP